MTLDSAKVKNYAIALLSIALTVCIVVVTRNVNRAVKTIADYADIQAARLQSEKNLKAVDAGIAAAATWQATGRIVNTITLPLLHQTIESLNESTKSLDKLIVRTDQEINTKLLPSADGTLNAATKTIEAGEKAIGVYGQTAEVVNKSIAELSDEGRATISEAKAVIASPDIKQALFGLAQASSSLALTTKNLEAITGNTAEASKEMPKIAASIEKFSHTQSRFSKALIIARFAAIASAFVR